MIKVDLVNIQAIGEAHIELQENSIIEFVGDNSNGKSILAKVIDALTKGDLKDRETRRSLIKDGAEQGIFLMTKGVEQLGVLLKDELSECIVMYIPNINESDRKIVRPLGDREGVSSILKKFGFRVYASGDICLQLSPTFGGIPFVTTSGSVNHEIVEDILSDKVADEFLKTFSTITFPVFKEKIKNLKRDRDTTQAILDNMESYDWRAYDAFIEEARPLYLALKDFEPLTLKKIPVPPASIIPYEELQLRKIPIIHFYEYPELLKPITESLSNYIAIRNGVCPTCGKPLLE